ncbi:unnamed protein product, partial [Prorocentrum cordatum]
RPGDWSWSDASWWWWQTGRSYCDWGSWAWEWKGLAWTVLNLPEQPPLLRWTGRAVAGEGFGEPPLTTPALASAAAPADAPRAEGARPAARQPPAPRATPGTAAGVPPQPSATLGATWGAASSAEGPRPALEAEGAASPPPAPRQRYDSVGGAAAGAADWKPNDTQGPLPWQGFERLDARMVHVRRWSRRTGLPPEQQAGKVIDGFLADLQERLLHCAVELDGIGGMEIMFGFLKRRRGDQDGDEAKGASRLALEDTEIRQGETLAQYEDLESVMRGLLKMGVRKKASVPKQRVYAVDSDDDVDEPDPIYYELEEDLIMDDEGALAVNEAIAAQKLDRRQRLSISRLNERTRCANCGQKGHWRKECTNPHKPKSEQEAAPRPKRELGGGSLYVAAGTLGGDDFMVGSIRTQELIANALDETTSMEVYAFGAHSEEPEGAVDTAAGQALVGQKQLTNLQEKCAKLGGAIPSREAKG